ncbi:GT2 family glycosyltransferase [Fontibacillus solani]|uniref:GT2 family glycosyltransferase n=1 Tax=Fontibacillus solani TaxID=1572857 RepID=A0A7W3XSQ1_9BACL|nr:glycosyltransferase family 2 protein [Fontibacillus solani]MBA9086780.1 GT2 family glycosyltransferase [Fontibacillus solani]
MSTIDIIFVSYNSEKWISGLLKSLTNQNYPLKKMYLTFVDNNSKDNSRKIIESYENKHLFGGYQHFFLDKNLGFGKANNYGVNHTKQDYIFFLNIDTEVDCNCITELINAIDSSDDNVGLWESRQFPYEHPKVYNPVTMETSWSSGACCLVRRDYFIEIGMFDEKIFMYGEDVDLSWRFRAHGYKLNYVPKSVVHHYTYMSAGEVKPNQFYNSTYMNLMLRYKFGSIKDIIKGHVMFSGLLFINGPAKSHKSRILKKLLKSPFEGVKYRKWKRKADKSQFRPDFKLWDYEINKDGAFYVNEQPDGFPLVSILIRTCGRPNVLREALLSVRNQTYKNIEVIIVEDGPPISESLLHEEFQDLNIVYKSTNDKVGRCIVGNMALELARGKYFNFLDDDDLLYADHVEVLVSSILKHPECKAAYSISFEVPTEVVSREPYIYREIFHNVQHRQPFNRLVLMHHNYFPIQTVLFDRQIYEDLGGIDPDLEVLEDWDLWMRYAFKYDFLYVEKLTSLYRVPSNISHNTERQALFDQYLSIVREKNLKYKFQIDMASIFKDVEYLMEKPPTIIYKIKGMSFRTLLFKVKNKLFYYGKKILK